jgi:hypothetical protein
MTFTAERVRLPRGSLPNFIVAAVSQSGTTRLFDALSAHPEVCGSAWKETTGLDISSGDQPASTPDCGAASTPGSCRPGSLRIRVDVSSTSSTTWSPIRTPFWPRTARSSASSKWTDSPPASMTTSTNGHRSRHRSRRQCAGRSVRSTVRGTSCSASSSVMRDTWRCRSGSRSNVGRCPPRATPSQSSA